MLDNVLDLCVDSLKTVVCRNESCEIKRVHEARKCKQLHIIYELPYYETGCGPDNGFQTRSKRHAGKPWQAQNANALRALVYEAVSRTEPRTFQMILNDVRNNYGSCLDRSVYRHLKALQEGGEVVRLSWKKVHAYLLPGSKLLEDPSLVYEQIRAVQ